MAKKLIEQDDAARFLGISVDDLNSLRDRGKLFPKRDAGIWKYDQEELERYQRELAEGSGVGLSWDAGGLDEINLEDNLGADDSVLLSEAELGQSPETAKSTIIGKQKNPESSDIRLAGDSDLKLKSDEGTKPGATGSDLDILAASSDIKLAGDGSKPGSALGSGLFDDDDFKLEPIGDAAGQSGGSFKLVDDEINLEGGSDKADAGDGTRKGIKSDGSGLSGLELEGDDDLVLSGPGSDVTLGAADSGIRLVDPADSGLALDQPLSLGGSAAGGDDLIISEDDMITLEEQVDLEGATQLRADEDFSLTPGAGGEDDSDSGSQVIALDSEDDMSAGSLFGSQSSDSLLQEDSFGGVGFADAGAGAALGAVPMMMPMAAMPEAPYSALNIVSLLMLTIFMMLAGVMVYDLAMQMWSWNTPMNFNSSLMDSLLNLFEKK